MHPDDPTWKSRLVITRIPPKHDHKAKTLRVRWRPVVVGDLSLRDWWTIVTHVMREPDIKEFYFIGRTGKYNVELREVEDTDGWAELPEKPKIIVKRTVIYRRRKRKVNLIVHDPASYAHLNKPKDVHPQTSEGS